MGALDWEQWQGPVKTRIPPDPFIFRNWRFIGEYGGGIVTDHPSGSSCVIKACVPP